jgi:ribonuclease HII
MIPLISSYQSAEIEAGCDEAGRGCLAGPVFAAAVILPKDTGILGLNDSKQLSERERNLLAPEIKAKAVAWAVSRISESVIDKINILNASIQAMNEALATLSITPKFVIIDGNRFYTNQQFQYKCIIKGDSLYQSIAAASILAKTARDEYMRELHLEYPQYGWDKNMGYGTLFHRKALAEYGPSPYHRKSFHLKNQLSLF